jgi:hypothetical protein
MKPTPETMGLTQDLLKELFDYKDGELYWKVSGSGRKIWGQSLIWGIHRNRKVFILSIRILYRW